MSGAGMHKGRLEAFSDGVLAIIITIMVLEMKVPHGEELKDLLSLAFVFLSYVISFIYVGIYWNNHHHMMQAAQKVNGQVLWANLHLLFWLSLLPFASGWMGENHFAMLPVLVYGFVLLMSAIAYYILSLSLISHHGTNSDFAKALGSDFKGRISVVIYIIAILMTFVNPWIGYALNVCVALMWLVPDRRFEKLFSSKS